MKKVLLATAALAAIGPVVASAALVPAGLTLNITSAVTQMTNLNSTAGLDTKAADIQAALASGAPHDYLVTFMLQVTGTPSGDQVGFGSMSADFALSGGAARSTVPAHANYVPANPQVNVFGSGQSLFGTDADAGTPSDLQGVLVGFSTALTPNDGSADDGTGNAFLEAVAPNAAPVTFGKVWVSSAGTLPGSIAVNVTEWSTSNSTGGAPTTLELVTGGTNTAPATVNFAAAAPVPEPATIGLVGLGGLLTLARRRRRA